MGIKRVERFDVWLIELDPTRGSEIRKTRPCLIVSPDEMNKTLSTVIAAPMTTAIKSGFPTRILCTFQGKEGHIVTDQLQTVVKERFVKRLGRIDAFTGETVLAILQEMFAP